MTFFKTKAKLNSAPDSRRFGKQHEALAAGYLQQKGLSLIDSNYQCRVGEIDLIMRDQHDLVFVEVRYRSHPLYGSAAESVTVHKQRRLIRCAQFYLSQHRLHNTHGCRFDVLAMSPDEDSDGDDLQYQWIKAAFCL